MRPMSLYESGESSGAVSLSTLFSPEESLIFAENKASLEDIAFLICRGGWPQATFLKGEDALVQSFDYLDAVVKWRFPQRDPSTSFDAFSRTASGNSSPEHYDL